MFLKTVNKSNTWKHKDEDDYMLRGASGLIYTRFLQFLQFTPFNFHLHHSSHLHHCIHHNCSCWGHQWCWCHLELWPLVYLSYLAFQQCFHRWPLTPAWSTFFLGFQDTTLSWFFSYHLMLHSVPVAGSAPGSLRLFLFLPSLRRSCQVCLNTTPSFWWQFPIYIFSSDPSPQL